jgi:hypothetical protein
MECEAFVQDRDIKMLVLKYCDVLPESRNIGARIYDCSRDNGAAKHNSPTTNKNSWERCVTTEL